MVWGDLEASLFASSLDGDKSLSTLNCPVLMSPNEVGVIKATFTNPTDKDWQRYTRVFISDGFVTLQREIKMTVDVPQGQKRTVSWEIYPEDAVYDRFIFYHIYVNARYPYPSLDGSCGVVLLDLWGLTGRQSFYLIGFSSIISIVLGIFLWRSNMNHTLPDAWYTFRSMIALAVTVYLGLVVGVFGAWVFALLLLMTSLLLTGIIIGRKTSP
jgi:hypothetical protein